MASILIIEDEDAIRRGLCDLLAYQGHRPHGVGDGTQGLEAALTGRFDLAIVDVMLPGVDGFQICRSVREALPTQALLLLTAKGLEEDILEGFRAGCDDYVTKPFSVGQLSARVDALLRRAAPTSRVLDLGSVKLDVDNLEVRGPTATCRISRRDAEVLVHLHREQHRIVARNDLLRDVWGYPNPEAVQTRAVDMHLVKLRRKLEAVTDAPLIETVRGAGYRLVTE